MGGVKDLRWRIWGGQAVIFWFLGPRRSSSKFLITAVRRTSKFIAAGKISILTDNLLTRWELLYLPQQHQHHRRHQHWSIEIQRICGKVKFFIVHWGCIEGEVYHWQGKWGSACSLLGEIRSLSKLGAIGGQRCPADTFLTLHKNTSTQPTKAKVKGTDAKEIPKHAIYCCYA